MLVTEFIEQLNKINEAGASSAREKFIADRIKRKYVPVLEKTAKLKVVLESSISNKAGEVPYIDMVVNKINYVCSVIEMYTDIEAEKTSEGNVDLLGLYDILKGTGLDKELYERIGDDLNELAFFNEQMLDTWHLKNSSAKSLIIDVMNEANTFIKGFSDKYGDGLLNVLSDSQKTR